MLKSAKAAVLVTVLAFSAFTAEVTKSTAEDVQSVEVTVYNNNIGLVKELRKIKAVSGAGELRYVDVAAQINPVTVHIKPLTNANEFTVLEQNYEYDLISHQKLLDKYVGKKIKIVDWNEFKDRKTTVEAELLSSGFGNGAAGSENCSGYLSGILSAGLNNGLCGGGEVYRIGNEIYLGHPGTKVLPALPDNLISRPTLSWLYSSKTAREYQLEVSYLTNGLSWSADYIFVVSDTKPAADISGWVTVNNRSGAAYNKAKLKLIAGKVNQVQTESAFDRQVLKSARNMDYASGAPAFAQSDVFEYKMYDLERPTTIKDNQTKQISLLEGRGLTIEKEYITYSDRGYGRARGPDGIIKQAVTAYITFKNTKENRLGAPLPAGTIRLYTADAKGRQQFIGEDRIEHTPKDEQVRLKAGEAFDIVVERKQLDFTRKTSQISETEWEIKIRNRKEENVTLGVIESAYHNNWEITESTHKHTKVDANTLRFDVAVPKGKEVVVKYKIRAGL